MKIFKKLANSFRLYATKKLIWIKDAQGIKFERQNEEGIEKINFFKVCEDWISWYKIMEMETLFTR